jgi:tetratricopeptide (TPR) repeat protein
MTDASRPAAAVAAHEEGVAHHAAGRFAQAIDAYRRALASGLAVSQAHVNLANALRMTGREAEALPHFEEAVRLDPASADAQGFLGVAYFIAGRAADAVEALRRALELRPDFAAARVHLANALAAAGRKAEALAAFRSALARNPRDENALADMGALLVDMGDLPGARRSVEAALRLRPDHPVALLNLGLALREEGRIDEAAALFERAAASSPGYARAEHNLALARLTRGRYAEGWSLYEARFRTAPPVSVWRDFPFPAFTAADFGGGHRVAIWREQGIGDQILYSTPLVDLESRGESFTLEADARLVPALARAHPAWTIVAPPDSPAAFAGADRHAPLASMAGMLRPDAASFERQPRAFLAPDPDRAMRYRELLASPGRRVVGISWRSFQQKDRAYLETRKSAPLSAFARLAARADLRLVDLQYGDTSDERARFEGDLARIDGLDLFNDLDGLLAAIDACDVVVTTSNVTAHLAGAAGKRTLLIYLQDIPPFHYWATDGEGRCRWYPSVRIVTGRDIDTWPRAIERVDELLGR